MNSVRKVCVVVLALLVFATSADAAIYETEAKLAEGALFALDPMFDSVGAVYFQDSSSGNWGRGSGVVVGDGSWVLTAAHNLVHWEDTSDVRFYLGDNLFESYTEVIADAWYPYPGYLGGTHVGEGHDIGLVHLVDPIFDVAPAVVYTGEDLRGTLMYMAGYGNPGTASTGPGDFDGVQRAGSNIAQEFGGDRVPWDSAESQYWLADFDLFYDDLQPLEWQSSPGDSGGGWFADIDGQMQLVGIHHGSLGNYGAGVSAAIRVSLYEDWIDETMGSPVPEPSSIVIFGSGALMLLGGTLCSTNQ